MAAIAAGAADPAAQLFVDKATGVDNSTCGLSEASGSPCASVAYAINHRSSTVQPLDSWLTLMVGPGLYDSSSCNGSAIRPIRMEGHGADTVVDCAGEAQFLTTNSSIVMSGFTLVGGHVEATVGGPGPAGPGVNTTGTVAVSVIGGGAVSVQWAASVSNATADFQDVTFVNNSVDGTFTGLPSTVAYFGGGAVLIVGGANDSKVVFTNCELQGNRVSVVNAAATTSFANDSEAFRLAGFLHPCGGAVCALVALDSSAVDGAELLFQDVLAVGNTVTASRPQAHLASQAPNLVMAPRVMDPAGTSFVAGTGGAIHASVGSLYGAVSNAVVSVVRLEATGNVAGGSRCATADAGHFPRLSALRVGP
jgi:hypothetical protein